MHAASQLKMRCAENNGGINCYLSTTRSLWAMANRHIALERLARAGWVGAFLLFNFTETRETAMHSKEKLSQVNDLACWATLSQ